MPICPDKNLPPRNSCKGEKQLVPGTCKKQTDKCQGACFHPGADGTDVLADYAAYHFHNTQAWKSPGFTYPQSGDWKWVNGSVSCGPSSSANQNRYESPSESVLNYGSLPHLRRRTPKWKNSRVENLITGEWPSGAGIRTQRPNCTPL